MNAGQPRRRTGLRTAAGRGVAAAATAASGAWASLALWYAGPGGSGMRGVLCAGAALLTIGTLAGLRSPRWRSRALCLQGLAFAAVLTAWLSLEPSHQREWQPDVAVLPRASVEGDIVTLRGIRNFDYRSEFDYTPAWYDKRFRLAELEGVDLIVAYWTGPAIAHVFVSFAFAGDERVAISIEARKERHEGYSALAGFFRQYELIYVVADERDVVRLRTNHRKDPPEEVYVYRVRGPIEDARGLFLAYVEEIDALGERPRFYNTLTTNCTTSIWLNTRANSGHLPFDWRILASGYVPEFLFEHGRLDDRIPFAELKRRAHVNARAQAADRAADFSRRIRAWDGGATGSAAYR